MIIEFEGRRYSVAEKSGSVRVIFKRKDRYGQGWYTDRRIATFGETAKRVRAEARRLGHKIDKPLTRDPYGKLVECEA